MPQRKEKMNVNETGKLMNRTGNGKLQTLCQERRFEKIGSVFLYGKKYKSETFVNLHL